MKELPNTVAQQKTQQQKKASILARESQAMHTTSMAKDRGMGDEDVVHIHNGIPLGHPKEDIMP